MPPAEAGQKPLKTPKVKTWVPTPLYETKDEKQSEMAKPAEDLPTMSRSPVVTMLLLCKNVSNPF